MEAITENIGNNAGHRSWNVEKIKHMEKEAASKKMKNKDIEKR